MINLIRKGMVFVSMLLFAVSICNATIDDNVVKAVEVLKGSDNTKHKAEAITVLKMAAERDTNVYAMNALGIVYMNGIGTERDTTAATMWLERAGEHGSNIALRNLGMMYKYSHGGVIQNFARAYGYFSKAAAGGSTMALYDKGYMLYKGLGCNQDYKQAVELFRLGADKDHAPCLYMLGLCYRNGYGVERDEERAGYYLNRAAMLNYRDAVEELGREYPENDKNDMIVMVDGSIETPETMPDIVPVKVDTSLIAGNYKGVLVVYDWSGRNIVGRKPLSLNLQNDNGQIHGLWCEGKDTVSFRASVLENGRIKFLSGMMRQTDRYITKDSVLYKFENADINVCENSVTGSVRLYSISEKEPQRPMYICLQKDYSDGDMQRETDKNDTRLYAWPNPFSGNVTLNFDLVESVDNALISIYNQSGMPMYTTPLGTLQSGKHSFTITPSIPDGIYLLNVTAGNNHYKTIIVKKMGKR